MNGRSNTNGQNLHDQNYKIFIPWVLAYGPVGKRHQFSPPDRISEDNYNMVIVEKLLSVDWQELKHQPWLSQIQEFLISMLQIEEQARPSALDITNVLLEVCHQCKGPTLLEYVQKNPEFFIALAPDYEELLQASAITAPIVEPLSFVPNLVLERLQDSYQKAIENSYKKIGLMNSMERSMESKFRGNRNNRNNNETSIKYIRSGIHQMIFPIWCPKCKL